MEAIINFFKNLGPIEFIITICLAAICLIAYFDGRGIDKKLDNDKKRFEKRYGKK